MDQTHLHLLITHLPIYGSVLGGFVLAYGLWTRSVHTMISSYLLLIISALGAGIAYYTGEAAEETAERIQGVAENMIEQHEDFAIYALWGLIIVGALSLIGILFSWRKWSGSRPLGFVLLLMALVSFGLVAYTGFLGGQIRHTEISGTTPNSQPADNFGEGDD